eukprot:jgi/Tetstr1/465301/TSEL_009999.t1
MAGVAARMRGLPTPAAVPSAPTCRPARLSRPFLSGRLVARGLSGGAIRHQGRQLGAQERWRGAMAAAQAGAGGEEDAGGMVQIGRISTAHGVRGELKVIPSTDFPEERFMTPGVRYLQAPMGTRKSVSAPFTPVNLTGGRMILSKGREMWLVRLAEVRSKEERPELEADEVYAADLIDMPVFLQESGERIGTVQDIYTGTGEHDTVRVALLPGPGETPAESGTFLIPYTAEMVPEVDVAAGRMVIDPPEGLLEATTVKPKSKPKRMPRRRKAGNDAPNDATDSPPAEA